MKQLKVPNKYERQLVFNYNSDQKMKEILNKFLDRIIVEVLANVSQMNKAVETINYYEQLAIGQGLSAKNSKGGISESELNDMRIKYTKESAWGEILKICRDQMT
jgi:predicted RecB family endonuclease